MSASPARARNFDGQPTGEPAPVSVSSRRSSGMARFVRDARRRRALAQACPVSERLFSSPPNLMGGIRSSEPGQARLAASPRGPRSTRTRTGHDASTVWS
jgi:hypothetical protein